MFRPIRVTTAALCLLLVPVILFATGASEVYTNPASSAPADAAAPRDTVYIPARPAEVLLDTAPADAAAPPDTLIATPPPRERGPWVIGFGFGIGGSTHHITLHSPQAGDYSVNNGFVISELSLYMRYELNNRLAIGGGYSDHAGTEYDFWGESNTYDLSIHCVNFAADYFLAPTLGFIGTAGAGVTWTSLNYVAEKPASIQVPSESDLGPYLLASLGYQFRRGRPFQWRIGVTGELYFYSAHAFDDATPYSILADFEFRWRL